RNRHLTTGAAAPGHLPGRRYYADERSTRGLDGGAVFYCEGRSETARRSSRRASRDPSGGDQILFSRRSGAGATFRLGRYRAALVMAAEAEGRPVRADLQGRRVAAVFEGIGVSRSTANGSDSRARGAADRSSAGTAGTRMAQRSPREDSPHTGQEAADRDSARHGGGTDHGRRTRTSVAATGRYVLGP